jgi:hypothetical protein
MADSEPEARDCQEFQRRLTVLLETGEDLYRDPHLQTCEHCRALVVDLEKIAENARELFGPKD